MEKNEKNENENSNINQEKQNEKEIKKERDIYKDVESVNEKEKNYDTDTYSKNQKKKIREKNVEEREREENNEDDEEEEDGEETGENQDDLDEENEEGNEKENDETEFSSSSTESGDEQMESEVENNEEKEKKKKDLFNFIEQNSDIRKLFNLVDDDNDNLISPQQLQTAFRCFGKEYPIEKIIEMIKNIDQDGNGMIDIFEFSSFMKDSGISLKIKDEELKNFLLNDIEILFKMIDKDGNGSINSIELKFFFERLIFKYNPEAEEISEEEINNLIKKLDLNNDGVIEFEELQSEIRKNHNFLDFMLNLARPSPFKTLDAFSHVPSSSRKTFLGKILKHGTNREKLYLTPILENGIFLRDIVIDPSTKRLLPCFVKTYFLSLINATNLPIKDVDSLENKVYISLFDEKEVVSNIYCVTCSDVKESQWKFGSSQADNNIIIRTFSSDFNLSILFELAVKIKKNSKTKPVEYCIASGKIKLNANNNIFQDENMNNNIQSNYNYINDKNPSNIEFLRNRIKKINLFGGNAINSTQISKSDVSEQNDMIKKISQIIVGKNDNTTLSMKIHEVDFQNKKLFSKSPPNLIMRSNWVNVLNFFREFLGLKLCGQDDKEQNLSQLNSPIYNIIPMLMEKDFVFQKFVDNWRNNFKGFSKKEKNDLIFLKKQMEKLSTQFLSVLNIYSFNQKEKEEKEEIIKNIEESTLKPNDFFKKEFVFKPFDMNENFYDFI